MKMAILRTFLLAYSSEESVKVYANIFRFRLEKHLLVKDLVAIFKIIVWLKNPMSSSGKINFFFTCSAHSTTRGYKKNRILSYISPKVKFKMRFNVQTFLIHFILVWTVVDACWDQGMNRSFRHEIHEKVSLGYICYYELGWFWGATCFFIRSCILAI